MSYAGPSNFAFFKIIKKSKTAAERLLFGMEQEIGVEGKILGVNYFESVYSPMLTASFLEIDTGGTVANEKGQSGTLKDKLPIEGFEEVLFSINTCI